MLAALSLNGWADIAQYVLAISAVVALVGAAAQLRISHHQARRERVYAYADALNQLDLLLATEKHRENWAKWSVGEFKQLTSHQEAEQLTAESGRGDRLPLQPEGSRQTGSSRASRRLRREALSREQGSRRRTSRLREPAQTLRRLGGDAERHLEASRRTGTMRDSATRRIHSDVIAASAQDVTRANG